ncbi:LOW QUALITY PROTEIN: phosphomevalonate kinase, peroxisomal [Dioscorea cayenensis subsp. rotundata]|uniref:phosphomevalonate kinase n=1 Tax=Dioscorea cayennensis subsp. rotundata TaxID=55577 RepID=A0AB40B5R2_DIOCR|nr:LOW QUALITY PROTEIN: phosphomevalonate kinase, peroxisomal [Dioscorea cayenensis subsp. rotundata]
MAVVASAPGKVLITGGYLILERPNPGIVLSTTARFYAIVKPIREEIDPSSWAWAWTDVKVSSPQLSREATYKMSLKHFTLQCTSSRDSSNPFVERALEYTVAAAKAISSDNGTDDQLNRLLLQGLDITIIGSNDFYSYRSQLEAHGLPFERQSLELLPPFSLITFNEDNGTQGGAKSKPEVAKTGLGSSAAMTTSVVAALLHYLGIVGLPFVSKDGTAAGTTDSDLSLVHAIAQTAHCIAQGKIGSGFDVCAAVYGSQRYVRFSPSVLSSAQAVGGKQLPDVINDILKEKWDHEKLSFSLPPLMSLLLGEPGTGGSSTPSMVGSVKQWQKSDPQKSAETWTRLANANSMLELELNKLNKFALEQRDSYKHVISSCSGYSHEKWVEQATDQTQESIVKSLLGAREAFVEIRFQMQLMGKEAGVPIEPESQSRLLDATMSMKGVLLAGVPGAGGYDAVFAIILGESTGTVSDAWSSQGVLPLLVRENPDGVLLEDGDPRTREVSSSIASININ